MLHYSTNHASVANHGVQFSKLIFHWWCLAFDSIFV